MARCRRRNDGRPGRGHHLRDGANGRALAPAADRFGCASASGQRSVSLLSALWKGQPGRVVSISAVHTLWARLAAGDGLRRQLLGPDRPWAGIGRQRQSARRLWEPDRPWDHHADLADAGAVPEQQRHDDAVAPAPRPADFWRLHVAHLPDRGSDDVPGEGNHPRAPLFPRGCEPAGAAAAGFGLVAADRLSCGGRRARPAQCRGGGALRAEPRARGRLRPVLLLCPNRHRPRLGIALRPYDPARGMARAGVRLLLSRRLHPGAGLVRRTVRDAPVRAWLRALEPSTRRGAPRHLAADRATGTLAYPPRSSGAGRGVARGRLRVPARPGRDRGGSRDLDFLVAGATQPPERMGEGPVLDRPQT